MDDDTPAFVPLNTLKEQAPRDAASILAELRTIYFKTSKRTIEADFVHALELLKSLPDEESREKATVYMQGISEMQHEWRPKEKPPGGAARKRRPR